MAFSLVSQASAPLRLLRLAGLTADARYRIDDTENVIGGDELLYRGMWIDPPLSRDYTSRIWHLTRL
ncbi:GH36 C-terminal domain-containing protein [Citrobacter murliniae]